MRYSTPDSGSTIQLPFKLTHLTITLPDAFPIAFSRSLLVSILLQPTLTSLAIDFGPLHSALDPEAWLDLVQSRLDLVQFIAPNIRFPTLKGDFFLVRDRSQDSPSIAEAKKVRLRAFLSSFTRAKRWVSHWGAILYLEQLPISLEELSLDNVGWTLGRGAHRWIENEVILSQLLRLLMGVKPSSTFKLLKLEFWGSWKDDFELDELRTTLQTMGIAFEWTEWDGEVVEKWTPPG